MLKFKLKFLIVSIIAFTSIATFYYFEYIKEIETKRLMQTPYAKGYINKKEQLINLKNKHHYKFIMIGDSLTAGNNWNKSLKRTDILNMGQGADFTYRKYGSLDFGIINRLDGLDSIYKEAFLMIGINDFKGGREPDEVFKTYVKIINIIADKNIVPIIQSTLYITNNKYNWDYAYLNTKVKELNNLLKNYCQSHNIQFINLNQYLSSDEILKSEYTYDGVHINATGYKEWSAVIEPYINSTKLKEEY